MKNNLLVCLVNGCGGEGWACAPGNYTDYEGGGEDPDYFEFLCKTCECPVYVVRGEGMPHEATTQTHKGITIYVGH